MASMTSFFSTTLSIVADFLSDEPIIYLFGLFCLLFVVKAFKIIIT